MSIPNLTWVSGAPHNLGLAAYFLRKERQNPGLSAVSINDYRSTSFNLLKDLTERRFQQRLSHEDTGWMTASPQGVWGYYGKLLRNEEICYVAISPQVFTSGDQDGEHKKHKKQQPKLWKIPESVRLKNTLVDIEMLLYIHRSVGTVPYLLVLMRGKASSAWHSTSDLEECGCSLSSKYSPRNPRVFFGLEISPKDSFVPLTLDFYLIDYYGGWSKYYRIFDKLTLLRARTRHYGFLLT